MRLILSRKGFDSQYGGCASPIFPGGMMASLPIPSRVGPPTFGGLNAGPYNLGEVVQDLTAGRKVPIASQHGVHLDPDIDQMLTSRESNWRGAFGQVGAAQGHLAGHGVESGDLFLFFGWFRRVERNSGRWCYVREAPNLHVLFGWLQIAEIQALPTAEAKRNVIQQHAWLRDHPHMRKGWDPPHNTLYVAQDKLRLGRPVPDRCGYGTFRRFDPALQLTWTGHSRCYWKLPQWIMPGTGKPPLSYHRREKAWAEREGAVLLRTAARGQEFVLDCDHYPEAIDWCQGLIGDHG